MSLPGLSLEEGVSALELVWHTVVKNNGSSVKVLGPKDLFDPVPSQLQDTSDRPRTQRGILTRDIHNEISLTSNKSTLSAGLGPLTATAASAFTTLAADISSAATYSPKRFVDNENLNYTIPRSSIIGTPNVKPSNNFGTGFTSSPWSDTQSQSWGRQAFGIQLTKSIKAREQSVHSPWPLPPTPIGSPSLTAQQLSQSTQSQTAHNNANFERWCRNRLLEDKVNSHGSAVEDTPAHTPLQSPTVSQPSTTPRFLLPPPGKEAETANDTEPTIVEDACGEQGKKIVSLSNSESIVRGEGQCASNCNDSPRPNTRVCKFLKHKSGCMAGVDCPYIHPGHKRTPSPKKEEADRLTGIGPRAIIMRGTSITGKSESNSSGRSVCTFSPGCADPPKAKASFPPVHKPITILQRPASQIPSVPTPTSRTASPPTTSPITPPATTSASTAAMLGPSSTNYGLSTDMNDIGRPKGIKEFCTYWIRTGKCDFYNQQGCAYSHDKDAYYAKYPVRPAPIPPPVVREKGEEIPRDLKGSKWANKGLGELNLTIITKAPLPAPLFTGRGGTTGKRSPASAKASSSPPAVAPTTATTAATAPAPSKKGGATKKFVIRNATLKLNSGRWPRGEKLPGAATDDEASPSSEETDIINKSRPSAPKRNAIDNAKVGIDDLSFLRPWNKVPKKPAKSGKGGKAVCKGGHGKPKVDKPKEDKEDLLMPWIENQTKMGIETKTGMKVEVGDLLALDDSVVGSALELKNRT